VWLRMSTKVAGGGARRAYRSATPWCGAGVFPRSLKGSRETGFGGRQPMLQERCSSAGAAMVVVPACRGEHVQQLFFSGRKPSPDSLWRNVGGASCIALPIVGAIWSSTLLHEVFG
jgi:hypothetical protein